MAGYSTLTRRVGGIPGGDPLDPHEAQLLNMRYVDEMVIDVSDYKSLKLIKLVGGLNKGGPWTAGKIEWLKEDLYRRADTTSGTFATAATAFPCTGKAHRYPIGTVLEMVEEATPTYARELLLVRAQASADQLTVGRGFSGSSDPATTYASGAKFRVAGFAHSENQDWTAIMTTMKEIEYNYPSIIAFAVESTFRNEGIARYGQGGLGKDFDDQVAKALKRATVELEMGLLLGRRNAGTAGAPTTDPSMMGGVLEYVDSGYNTSVVETDKAGGPLTLKDINDTLQSVAEIVGEENVARTLLTGYWGHRKINSFYEPSVRLARVENTVGLLVQRIDTVIGEVEIVSDAHMPPGIMLFLAPEQVSMGPMAGMGRLFVGDNPSRAGDRFQRFIYGDYSAEIKNSVTMSKITNFSTTA